MTSRFNEKCKQNKEPVIVIVGIVPGYQNTHNTHRYIYRLYLFIKMSAFDLNFYKGNSYLHVFIVWKISFKKHSKLPSYTVCIYIFNHIYPLVFGCARAGVLAQRLGIPSFTLLMLINLLYLF